MMRLRRTYLAPEGACVELAKAVVGSGGNARRIIIAVTTFDATALAKVLKYYLLVLCMSTPKITSLRTLTPAVLA